MAVRTTPPILLRDGPGGSQLAYLNTKGMLKDTAAGLGDMPLGLPCLVFDPSTGDLIGVKQTMVRGDHSTYCAEALTCPDGNCATVWYCTEAGAVEVATGSAAPTDYVSGPYLTKAAAIAICPDPQAPDGILSNCCESDVTYPTDVRVRFFEATGPLVGLLPDSIPLVLMPRSGYVGDQVFFNLNSPYISYTWSVSITVGCNNNGTWGLNIAIGTQGMPVSNLGYASAPWDLGGGFGSVGYVARRLLNCSDNYYLDSEEFVGEAMWPAGSIYGSGPSSVKLAVYRGT